MKTDDVVAGILLAFGFLAVTTTVFYPVWGKPLFHLVVLAMMISHRDRLCAVSRRWIWPAAALGFLFGVTSMLAGYPELKEMQLAAATNTSAVLGIFVTFLWVRMVPATRQIRQ